jgi:hypothetical protein
MPVSAAMPPTIWSPASDRRDNVFTLFRRLNSSWCDMPTADHFRTRTFCGCSSAGSDNNGSGSEDGHVSGPKLPSSAHLELTGISGASRNAKSYCRNMLSHEVALRSTSSIAARSSASAIPRSRCSRMMSRARRKLSRAARRSLLAASDPFCVSVTTT